MGGHRPCPRPTATVGCTVKGEAEDGRLLASLRSGFDFNFVRKAMKLLKETWIE